ncbi:UNVERIFIED_CONTAM: hypothetical protein Slati_3782600 [Sesamum latifolium]|uniref:CCHC-type domain-containing protein n=1 Tax=Sesamum latifolium TaxID=2727402 RepID=A0AAW2U4R6_9LAMI
MDMLPYVDKVYSMVIRVERQRKVHNEAAETGMNIAMYARNENQNRNIGHENFMKKRNVDNKNPLCESCGRVGHTKDTCFKIHGIPDWYKELSEKRKR